MRIIIGYGNDLRGEDAFGVDVIKLLQKQSLKDTKLIEAYQLTPELCLELLEADELVFVDAAYNEKNHYTIACHIQSDADTNLSHHISPKMIISMLNNLYKKYPSFQIYSMFTNQFDIILDKKKYENCIKKLCDFLSKEV